MDLVWNRSIGVDCGDIVTCVWFPFWFYFLIWATLSKDRIWIRTLTSLHLARLPFQWNTQETSQIGSYARLNCLKFDCMPLMRSRARIFLFWLFWLFYSCFAWFICSRLGQPELFMWLFTNYISIEIIASFAKMNWSLPLGFFFVLLDTSD